MAEPIVEVVVLIQRTGLKENLPTLDVGEFGFTTDTKELFIGSETGNMAIAKLSDIDDLEVGDKVEVSTTNGNLKVNGVEVKVYDDTAIQTALSNKVDKVTGKQLSTEDYTTAEKTKLDGIAEGATKVEASTENGFIKINGVETKVAEISASESSYHFGENQPTNKNLIWYEPI